jgi:high-affinity nickel-transport protein
MKHARLLATCSLLIVANIAAWGSAALTFAGSPVLWSLAMLSYVLGLRHALDLDHIAAIDNVVRRLVGQGKAAWSTGLFFSLGHSTVVVVACCVVAAATTALHQRLNALQGVGNIVGTIVSASFLLLIGLSNLMVLRRVWITLRQVQRARQAPSSLDGLTLTMTRGPLGRILRPLLSVISRPWQMYLVGLLFGLGFDTATEMGLLAVSAQGSMQRASAWSVLVFPMLFTAGMSLVDTTDSVFMSSIYGWASVRPLGKLWYNLSITTASVTIALGVGGLEVWKLIAGRFNFSGGPWHTAASLGDGMSRWGGVVALLFLVSWGLSVGAERLRQN